MLALELAAVSKRYRGHQALESLSLTLEEGSALGLLGPNGAGKTTTLRLLLGFVRPSSGGVSLRGRDPRDPESRSELGYLPERLALPGRMSVRDFLTLHAGLAGLRGAERRHRVNDVMEQVDVTARAGDRLGGLSKGLRQRVGFAQAFVGRPTLLLLDEPTSGLDPLGVRDAREWIHEARSQGCTILVSSHVLSEVERVCDQIAILHQGRLAASGPLEQVVAPGENLEEAFVRWVRG